MNKKNIVKVMATPIIATTLLLSTSGVFFKNEGTVYAAVDKTTEANKYADVLMKYLNDFEKQIDYLNNLDEEEMGEKEIQDLLTFIDKNYKDADYVKKNYNAELAKIHENLDNYVYSLYDIYSYALEEEYDEDTLGEELLYLFMQSLDGAMEYGEGLATYVGKYNIKPNNNLKQLVEDFGGELKATTPTTTTSAYTVKKNDTLYSIAKKYNTTEKELKTLNGLKSDNIYVGQKLKVKQGTTPTTKPSTSAPTNTTDANTYTVKKGDNLTSIAKKYNTTVKELKTLNGLKSDNIKVGQKLKIKQGTTPTTKPSTNPSTPTNTNTNTYTVKKGDNLTSIAKKYNTTVKELKTLNGLKKDTINVGQKLKVKKETTPTTKPSTSTPQASKTYKVKKDDTLYKIAKENKTTVNELKKINNLKNDNIKVGQTLIIKK